MTFPAIANDVVCPSEWSSLANEDSTKSRYLDLLCDIESNDESDAVGDVCCGRGDPTTDRG